MIGIALKIAKSKTARKAARKAAQKIREEVTVKDVDVRRGRIAIEAFGRTVEFDADDLRRNREIETESSWTV